MLRAYYVDQDAFGLYPVGFCAIVIARSEAEARIAFEAKMAEQGLGSQLKDLGGKPVEYRMNLIDTTEPSVNIVVSGDY